MGKYSAEVYEKVGLEPFYDKHSRQYKVMQNQDGFVYSKHYGSIHSCYKWIDNMIEIFMKKKLI